MDEVINGTWTACTAPSPSSPYSTYQPDVIISNPPVLVHVHLAEKLCVPLQIWLFLIFFLILILFSTFCFFLFFIFYFLFLL